MNISRLRDFPSEPLGDKPAGECWFMRGLYWRAPDYLEWRYGKNWETPNRNGGDWSGRQRV